MSRTKSFIYNSATVALLQVITMIAGLITPHIMLDTYGSEINGLISSIVQFISYFNLVEAGLSGAAVHALYKPIASSNHKAINAILSAAKKLYTQVGFIFASMIIGFSILYPLYIQTNMLSYFEIMFLIVILGVSGALNFFASSRYRVFLSADQKTYVISLASIASTVTNVIIIVVLANLGANIVLLKLVAVFSILLRNLILIIYCKKKYTFLNFKEPPDTNALHKRWDALYLQILGTIQNATPIVIITLITRDLKLVSVYTIFNIVIVGIKGVLSIFVNGLFASFGDVISKKEINVLQKAYAEFEFFYYALITFVYTVTLITIMPFIQIYTRNVTDVNYNVPIFGFLFALSGLLYNIKTPQGMLVKSAGLYKETKWQSTIQGAIYLIVSLLATPFLGISGVLLGAICSDIYRDIDLIFFIPKYVTKTKVSTTLFRVARIFICSFICFIPSLFIQYNPSTFQQWIGYASVISIYVFIVVFTINYFCDKAECTNIIYRIKRLIKK